MIQSCIAMETVRGSAKVAEMNSYVQALINPNISAATKARIEVLLASSSTVTDEIGKMQAAAAATPSAATSGPIPGSVPPSSFKTSVKTSAAQQDTSFPGSAS